MVTLLKDRLKTGCTLEWVHPNQIFTLKLQTNNLEVAKYLCTTLVDLSVSLIGSALCNMQVNSDYNTLAREDLQTF